MAGTRTDITALAFALVLSAGQASAAPEPNALVVHVDNYAGLSDSGLARAEAEAARVYAAAGVRTTWVHGDDEADARDAGGLHLRVLLLDREMTNHKTAAEDIVGNVLGRAARLTKRAYIFTPRVQDVALRNGKLFELVLGRVIAHEVGHLLLPEGSHSDAGIMRAQVNLTNSLATFTMPQTTEIQMAVSR